MMCVYVQIINSEINYLKQKYNKFIAFFLIYINPCSLSPDIDSDGENEV